MRRDLKLPLFGAAAAIIASVVISGVLHAQPVAYETPKRMPAPLVEASLLSAEHLQTAVLSGGCFWGVQGVFEHVKGVRRVLAGYSGGPRVAAGYEMVSTGITGHAESVQIEFDPRQISYGEILRLFFSVATDPTEVGGQFPDSGSQYRSEIFYTSATQQRIAEAYIRQLDAAHVFGHPITTRVDPDRGFYEAEAYHQDYLVLHPDQPYIAVYDLPKIAALQKLFPSDYRADPVTVSAV